MTFQIPTINLSNVDISNKAKVILQLGQQFNLFNKLTNKERITREFIKHVEYNLFKADEEICKSVRNETFQILKGMLERRLKLIKVYYRFLFPMYKMLTVRECTARKDSSEKTAQG